MTQAENPYRQDVFLEDLRGQKNRQQQRIWAEHQQMQLSFLQRRGLTSSSTVLDIGCGPMRLGSALIPLLNDGWYYGQDINPGTIAFGEEVLREAGIPKEAPYTLFASDQFDLALVDRPVQIAFANSRLQPPNAEFDLHSPAATAERAGFRQACFMPPSLPWSQVVSGFTPIRAISGGVRLKLIPIRTHTTIPFPCCRIWRVMLGFAWT